ncbi:AAA family ATPase [Staphylococcus felis]|uniref:AAA family ATPase n=1 Tax=Staphylococcus felis TaxID=46127 RepID=A0ABS0QLS8_9STAP|nr:AAA family ATPase [Staphylococcus felis]MBH9580091.1 AAA family ATPase [Staphylococcus felis]
MKVIGTGSRYEIYPDDLRTYEELPAATYKIRFNSFSGFSLMKVDNFTRKEPKIYGDHSKKVGKVLRTYDKVNRSLGVMLSGDKGVGKSIFVQLLAEKFVEHKPVIIVDEAFPGIAEFIESIDQEVLVMFDEFEKVFNEDAEESQDKLLGLLDGVSQKKKMFVITVNNIYRVSEYMINRPGRFHYHIRFGHLNEYEITEYMKDKVSEEYHGEIKAVTAFGARVGLNYDCLRAISFEIENGSAFKEAIKDLNIINVDDNYYDISLPLYIENEKEVFATLKSYEKPLDLFTEETTIRTHNVDLGDFNMTFPPSCIEYIGGKMIVKSENIDVERVSEGIKGVDNSLEAGDLEIIKTAPRNYSFNAI